MLDRDLPISSLNTPGYSLTTALVLLGIVIRLLSASVGDNFDMESWWIASEAFHSGEAIYTATHRYNYGPIWFWIIGGLRELSALTGPDSVHRLHLFLTGFLSLIDLALASIIYRLVSPAMALTFFLNPISLATTGYHIQFDNFAILIGLLAWLSFTRPSMSRYHLLGVGILFGLSLSIKHVFSLFLCWLPFLTGVRSLKERILFSGAAFAVFLLSFTPWINDASAWQGIQANVFGYLSTEGHSLTSNLASLRPGLEPRPLFITLIALTGALLLRFQALHTSAPYLYLIVLTALSSGMARNYLAVPLVGIFLLPRTLWFAAYFGVASIIFVTTTPALGTKEVILPFFSSPYITYELAQLLLLAGAIQTFNHFKHRGDKNQS